MSSRRSRKLMPPNLDQILTVAQMRAAEQALIDGGSSIDALMQTAGRGAADLVWRMAAGRAVTVLCGPGNNGGDGYVIAEVIRERGGSVHVLAAADAGTAAARTARRRYGDEVSGPTASPAGEVLVDCLFGSGLARPLPAEHFDLLTRLAASHPVRISIDVPSGVDSDGGLPLNCGLPQFDLTVALGAWKFAHFRMPALAMMGTLRLVPIGIERVEGAAGAISQPHMLPPGPAAHKYNRGVLGVVAGAMPGAALLASHAAQGAGAGYVKLLAGRETQAPPEIAVDNQALVEALRDRRYAAVLIGPGLGRDTAARARLVTALAVPRPMVVDADALMLLTPQLRAGRTAALIATPHEGELAALERAFELSGSGTRLQRAIALARRANMIVVAKGADTVIARPDGRIALGQLGSSWLSTAGTGDVLAGTIASRLANGADPFDAACQGLWLHGEAARRCLPPFSASDLAAAIRSAYAACL